MLDCSRRMGPIDNRRMVWAEHYLLILDKRLGFTRTVEKLGILHVWWGAVARVEICVQL